MGTTAEPRGFGCLLREYRLAANLTQETLAERAGLGVRSIQHLEGGAHLPHRETVDRLIRALGLSGHEGSHFERLAQPIPRARTTVAVLSDEVPGDVSHPRAPCHNLPAPLSSFVGREAEVAAIVDLLRTSRLVTLVGVGGCGKTRLALAVAERLREMYPDGVWLVELAPLADPTLPPKAIALALGIQEQPRQPLRDTLVASLRSRRLLLVLDNCEHLIADCARLTDDLLRTCPTLTVLATSREALGIPGEVAWRVPSLSLPDRGRLTENRQDRVASLLAAEAAQLFGQRARTADPSFAVTAENAGATAEICWRLDGIPLALELAAARINVLSVEQIAARLDDRFQLLTGGSRTVLPRQQTLRATLEWSLNLLSEPERAVFRRLSVFAGGFTLDAAEAVGGVSGVPTVDVLDLVSQLVDKSLVLVEKRGGEARYRLLETVRQFGHERLVEAGETAAIWDRLAEWCLGLAERAEAELIGSGQLDWLERLEVEHDNLRAALTWSQNRLPGIEIRLAGSLWGFWRMRGFYTEGRAWLDDALARLTGETAARAKALYGAGILAYEQADDQTALSLLEESVGLCRQVEAKGPLAYALHDYGFCLLQTGEDSERVKAVWDESLALAREVRDERAVACSLRRLGGFAAHTGEYDQARALIDEANRLFRCVGDSWSLCLGLFYLSAVLLLQGDVPAARLAAEEEEEIARRLGNRFGIGVASRVLAFIAQSEGDLNGARRLFVDGLRVFHEIGSGVVYDGLCDLGALAVRQGKSGRGVSLLSAGAVDRPQAHARRIFWRAINRAEWEASLATARSVLGEESFAQAWAEGQAMTLEQAVALAMSEEAHDD